MTKFNGPHTKNSQSCSSCLVGEWVCPWVVLDITLTDNIELFSVWQQRHGNLTLELSVVVVAVVVEMLVSYVLENHRVDILQVLAESDNIDHYSVTVKLVNFITEPKQIQPFCYFRFVPLVPSSFVLHHKVGRSIFSRSVWHRTVKFCMDIWLTTSVSCVSMVSLATSSR